MINALKHDIDQYVVAATEEGGPRQLKKELTALSEVVREERAAVQKVRILKQSLIAQGDKKLASWEKELEEKSARRDELDGLLKKIASSGDETEKSEQTFSLSLLRKRLIGVKDKISGITKTLKLRWQTQLIREITEEAGEVAGNKIREDLTKEANDRLKVVLSQDPLEIERIDRSHSFTTSNRRQRRSNAFGRIYISNERPQSRPKSVPTRRRQPRKPARRWPAQGNWAINTEAL